VLLSVFAVAQHLARQPMLPLGLFRRRDFAAAQIAAFAISASFFALYLYMTLYLQDVRRLSPIDAGLAYMPGTLLLFAASAASSGLTRRFRPATLVIGGLALVVPGLAFFAITGAHSSWTVILPGDLLVCLGTGLFNPALATIALGAGPGEISGLLAGVNDAFRQAGIAVGVAAFGALVPAAAALGHGSPHAYVAGLHHALFVGTAVAALGAGSTAVLIGAGRSPRKRGVLVPEPASEIA
jgi:predicted MFS family arabinose efflux permease